MRIQVRETNGALRYIGDVVGDTFVSTLRDPAKHGFRGGADTWARALAAQSAAWGVDLHAIETLARDHGVRVVEIRTRAARYRTTTELLLGPKGFVVEYGDHRRQAMLSLAFWTKLPA
jgi:hypothetical protein